MKTMLKSKTVKIDGIHENDEWQSSLTGAIKSNTSYFLA
jgi:hypothetical protein